MASQPSPLICLVAPGHLTATPRLIKEAEALTSAGYRVHTVSLDNFPLNRPLDDAILDKATWSATRIPAATGAHGIARRILHRGTQRLPASWLGALFPLAARAKLAEAAHLNRVLKTIPADYFLGHCLGSLSAVAAAARHRGVRFGFDLEDFHEAETLEAESNTRSLAATRNLCGGISRRRRLRFSRWRTCSNRRFNPSLPAGWVSCVSALPAAFRRSQHSGAVERHSP
jgi:hypothetical protein